MEYYEVFHNIEENEEVTFVFCSVPYTDIITVPEKINSTSKWCIF